MRAVVRGIAWLGILIGICVAPLAFALISTNRPGLGFWTDFSVALGFVGLALMGVEFALVARVKIVAEPFGTDALVDFHRQIGYAGLAFVLIHVALSAELGQVKSFTPAETPARVWFGAVATAALVVLVATSVWRRRMRLSYELWQILHTVLAVIAVVAALVHVLLVDYYVDTVWQRHSSGCWCGCVCSVRCRRVDGPGRSSGSDRNVTARPCSPCAPTAMTGCASNPASLPGSRSADRRSRSPPIRSRCARALRRTAASRLPSRPLGTSAPASQRSAREPRSTWTDRTECSRSTSTRARASA